MALYEKRIQARQMRREGESILIIAKKLGVSKASVSVWCRDIHLTKEQQLELLRRAETHLVNGRLIGAQINRQKRLTAITQANIVGVEQINNPLSERELLIVATSLYWAEGAKKDKASFQFVNSDPRMIDCMYRVLCLMGVQKGDFFCTIQINQIHEPRIDTVLKFWKNLLKFNGSQMRNPSFVRTSIRKVYENYDTYYGVCRLQVRRSTHLKYRVLGLIQALQKAILSA